MKFRTRFSPARLAAGFFSLLAAGGVLRGHEAGPYFAGDRILVDATINGKPVRFAYDTGADFTALFGSTAERLGLEAETTREISLAGHPVQLGQTDVVTVKLLGLEAKKKLTILLAANGGWLDGALSWRDLSVPYLLIDGHDRKFRLMNKAPEDMSGWQLWKLEKETRQLFFEVTKDGKTLGRVFVDTGASTGLRLAPKFWKQWRDENPDAGVSLETFKYLVGDAQVNEVSWANEYRLGDLTFHDVELGPIPVSKEKEGLSTDSTGKPFIAMIGVQALRRMQLIISTSKGEIWTRSVSLIPAHNRLGAVFVPRSAEDPALVARVLKGSPADDAGLKDGDVLLEIDGVDFHKGTSESGALPIQTFRKPAGTRVKLKIDREGEVQELSAALRDLLK